MMMSEDIIKEIGSMGNALVKLTKLLEESNEDDDETEAVDIYHVVKEITLYIDYINLATEAGSFHVDYPSLYPQTTKFFKDLGYTINKELKRIEWKEPQKAAEYKLWPFSPEYDTSKIHTADKAYVSSSRIIREKENELKANLFDATSAHGHYQLITGFPITDELKDHMAKKGISITTIESNNYVFDW